MKIKYKIGATWRVGSIQLLEYMKKEIHETNLLSTTKKMERKSTNPDLCSKV